MAIKITDRTVIDNSTVINNIQFFNAGASAGNSRGGMVQNWSTYGTVTGGTVTVSLDANFKTLTNNGAFTLEAPNLSPISPGGEPYGALTQVIYATNSLSLAGAITFSGFTKVTGVAYRTGNNRRYFFYITYIPAFGSHLHIVEIF